MDDYLDVAAGDGSGNSGEDSRIHVRSIRLLPV